MESTLGSTMVDDIAVLFVASCVNSGPSKRQRTNSCTQCEKDLAKDSTDCVIKAQFTNDESKWRHVWEHVRLTFNGATEPNPPLEAIKENGTCQVFFHERCFPMRKVVAPALKQRKRSSTEDRAEPETSNRTKRSNNLEPIPRPPLRQLNSANVDREAPVTALKDNRINMRKCEQCNREIEQTEEIRDRHVWHHLNKPHKTADHQHREPSPRFRCTYRPAGGKSAQICGWGTYIMVHMETHWREEHSHDNLKSPAYMPSILDLTKHLQQPFHHMKNFCFPISIEQEQQQQRLRQSEIPVATVCTSPPQSQPIISPLVVAVSPPLQAPVQVDDDEVILVDDDPPEVVIQMPTNDCGSLYSRTAVAQMCKECDVVHFDVAEHCASKHAKTFPFRCGNEECSATFSSIYSFVKHAAVAHSKKLNEDPEFSLLINKAQLKTLENSIVHCFGQLAFDNLYL